MEKYIYRKIRLNDLDNIENLLQYLYNGDVGDNLVDIIKQIIEQKNSIGLIVENDKQIIGFLLGTYRLEVDFECKAAIIEELVVDKDYQRKGIAKKLLGIFNDWAQEQNCKGILVPCGREGFYEKVGFSGFNIKRYWKDI